jgi:ribosomal protein S18 acetylase RimI-like enzyme
MTVEVASRCELLPWDSKHFGFTIARLRGGPLTEKDAVAVDAWCAHAGVRCLYFEAAPDDLPTSLTAAKQGYRLVDIRLVFEQQLRAEDLSPGLSLDAPVRSARPQDIGALETIARESFRPSRYYFDEGFPRDQVDQMYAIWVGQSVSGNDESVLVSGQIGRPDGLITCHLDHGGSLGRIGLVGIEDQVRGRGIARALVLAALSWFRSRGSERVQVTTQGRNIAAQRLYQRCGFLTHSVSLYYHKWYS